jgi:hypothetical protein
MAFAAVDEGTQRNPVSRPELIHALAHLYDIRSELVAQYRRTIRFPGQRMRPGWNDDWTIPVFVKVGTANTADFDLHFDLAWPGPGIGNIFYPNVFFLMPDSCLHTSYLPIDEHGISHLVTHWANQVEFYLAMLERKILTPNKFSTPEELESEIIAFLSPNLIPESPRFMKRFRAWLKGSGKYRR